MTVPTSEGQLRRLQASARKNAVDHGFTDATFGERIALIHSELSEALEDYRERGDEAFLPMSVFNPLTPDEEKPIGVPSEMADVVIRVLDLCGRYNIDLEDAILKKMAYNEKRPYLHGGKVL